MNLPLLYVLDTDTITFLQAHRDSVVKRLAATGAGQALPTVVTMAEQLRGRLADVHRAHDSLSLQRAYERLRSTQRYYCEIMVLPFDVAAADIFDALVAERLRVGTQDLRIAAITLANDATLVTGNRRDFERVPGLRVEDWTVA